jgi:hypothetical protein
MSLSAKRDKKDLKRPALMREHEGERRDLSLTPDELAALGRHLERALASQPCDHTQTRTKERLGSHTKSNVEMTLKALRNRGGYCDCEVLLNAV